MRDLLLGLAHDAPDIDLTTDARPEQILACVRPLADDVWTQGVRFGTVGCRIGERRFELTTHRSESYVSESRKPVVEYSRRVDDDLSRRDFTINAIAIDVETGEYVDPFGGRADLAARRLRTPLAAEVSFSDDPLRMLRAARFTARFDLAVAADVREAIGALRERLSIVSRERIHDEFERLLELDDCAAGLQLLNETGVLAQFLPMWSTLTPSRAVEVVGEVSRASATLARRAAAVADFDDASIRSWLQALRYSADDERATRTVCRVLRELALLEAVDDHAARRIVHGAGALVDAVIDLAQARRVRAVGAFEVRRQTLAAAGELDDLGPELDGDRVQAVLQIAPGRDVGRGLAFLQELRLREGRVGPHEAALRLRAFFASAQHER